MHKSHNYFISNTPISSQKPSSKKILNNMFNLVTNMEY